MTSVLAKVLRWAASTRYVRREVVLSAADVDRISGMLAAVGSGPPETRPSRFWAALNDKNIDQLTYAGFDNFKRSIALNYFTFVNVLPWDPQVQFFLANLPKRTVVSCARRAVAFRGDAFASVLGLWQRVGYCFLSLCGWKYVQQEVSPDVFGLSEPAVGNPVRLRDEHGRLVSSDLSNSVLEYATIAEHAHQGDDARVLEIGAGYGRTAFVFLSQKRALRYTIVDIAPALWLAERYLTTLFPERRAFRWRQFDTFAAVRDEFAHAELAFFTADQLRLLPRCFDLVINISSLHEMRPEQITYYLEQIDRVLMPGGTFYSKQWRTSVNPVDKVRIRAADYPIPLHWRKTLSRAARVQTSFFEEVYIKQRAPGRPRGGSLVIPAPDRTCTRST